MRVVLHLVLLLALVVLPSWRASASSYVCDGDALIATIDRGAVDAIGIPNSADGTVPGSFVVLEWRELHLQLPRTNNAGAPSFSDGKYSLDLSMTGFSAEEPELLSQRSNIQGPFFDGYRLRERTRTGGIQELCRLSATPTTGEPNDSTGVG